MQTEFRSQPCQPQPTHASDPGQDPVGYQQSLPVGCEHEGGRYPRPHIDHFHKGYQAGTEQPPQQCSKSHPAEYHGEEAGPHDFLHLGAGGAQGPKQGIFRLTFPRVQMGEEHQARCAGQRYGQEHQDQQCSPSGVDQRLFQLLGHHGRPVQRLPGVHSHLLQRSEDQLGVYGTPSPGQPQLVGTPGGARAISKGSLIEAVKVHHRKGPLLRVEGREVVDFGYDLQQQPVGGHAENGSVPHLDVGDFEEL